MSIDRVVPLARQLLVLPMGESRRDAWLWEHSERVMRLAGMIADLPELAGREIDRTALAAAALFHDAGWIPEFHQGRFERWQLLTRPTNDIQRELGAAMLLEEAGPLLPAPTARRAAEAIRFCNDRGTDLSEARILADAESIDEMGALYILRQFRQYQAEGRPLQQLVDSWHRQKEYKYWDVRLADGFRFESTRALARDRLGPADAFIAALGRDLHGNDLRGVLEHLGITPTTGPA